MSGNMQAMMGGNDGQPNPQMAMMMQMMAMKRQKEIGLIQQQYEEQQQRESNRMIIQANQLPTFEQIQNLRPNQQIQIHTNDNSVNLYAYFTQSQNEVTYQHSVQPININPTHQEDSQMDGGQNQQQADDPNEDSQMNGGGDQNENNGAFGFRLPTMKEVYAKNQFGN